MGDVGSDVYFGGGICARGESYEYLTGTSPPPLAKGARMVYKYRNYRAVRCCAEVRWSSHIGTL